MDLCDKKQLRQGHTIHNGEIDDCCSGLEVGTTMIIVTTTIENIVGYTRSHRQHGTQQTVVVVGEDLTILYVLVRERRGKRGTEFVVFQFLFGCGETAPGTRAGLRSGKSR